MDVCEATVDGFRCGHPSSAHREGIQREDDHCEHYHREHPEADRDNLYPCVHQYAEAPVIVRSPFGRAV